MKRENVLLENISKLNTYIHMTKSNDLLRIYLEKITNKKSKSLKFVHDFDYISLDLLYTSLSIMNTKDKITTEEFNKIDKGELRYYLGKIKGMNTFKKQVPSLNTEEQVVNYLLKNLSEGNYIVNNNNTVKFPNGLVLDSDWLVEFANFLTVSLNLNIYLSNDSKSFVIRTVEIPEKKDSLRNFLKELVIYEYVVTHKEKKKMTFSNMKYLENTLCEINSYDFKELQKINSKLSKDNFTLSINKQKPNFSSNDKLQLEKLLNESDDLETIEEYIKDKLNCYNTKTKKAKKELRNSYELLRSLTYAYKNSYNLVECRKLFDIDEETEKLNAALTMANFYINYVYDESNLLKHFNYGILELDEIKPTIIDYETQEYKTILKNLSILNKKSVAENRKINKILTITRLSPKSAVPFMKEESKALAKHCKNLEEYVYEARALREELALAKDENHRLENRNKTKLKYIKESIIEGTYTFDKDTSLLVFDTYSKKDYHHTFHLEIPLKQFEDILLSEKNRNSRINFYQI